MTLDIYKITRSFPKDELFGLTIQMRKSSSSIPTNIAEGCGRNSHPEMMKFLTIATGSCSELHYQLILALDLCYITENNFKELQNRIIDIRKMIYKFILGIRKLS